MPYDRQFVLMSTNDIQEIAGDLAVGAYASLSWRAAKRFRQARTTILRTTKRVGLARHPSD